MNRLPESGNVTVAGPASRSIYESNTVCLGYLE
jgi:hypothetical protein